MGRNQVERTLRGAYEARLSGDMGVMENAFAPDAQFELAGAQATSPIPGCCQGAEAIRSRLQALVDAFEMSNLEIVSMVVDLPKVAVRWRVDVRSTATGQSARTDLCDMIEMRDGKIASYTQFFDSALANRLAGA